MKAAAQNHANALYCVAHALRTGTGVELNEASAREYYEKAAAKGNCQARVVLQSWPERGFELPEQTAANATISEAARSAHRRREHTDCS